MEPLDSDYDILSVVFWEKLTRLLACTLQNQPVRVLAAERRGRGPGLKKRKFSKLEWYHKKARPCQSSYNWRTLHTGKGGERRCKRVFKDVKVLRQTLSNSLSYWKHYYWEASLERMLEWAEIINTLRAVGVRLRCLLEMKEVRPTHLVSSFLSGSRQRKDGRLGRQHAIRSERWQLLFKIAFGIKEFLRDP